MSRRPALTCVAAVCLLRSVGDVRLFCQHDAHAAAAHRLQRTIRPLRAAPTFADAYADARPAPAADEDAPARAAAEGAAEPEAEPHEPWAVPVSEEEGQLGRLSDATVARAVMALNSMGFAILRGASVYSDDDLATAHEAASDELRKVKGVAEARGLLPHAPWPHASRGRSQQRAAKGGNVFKFQEALSYTPGRLDMPCLQDVAPFGSAPWHCRPDLLRLCERLFGTACDQIHMGALWNFPRSGPPHWHRDGDAPLLTAVTVACDYPEECGFIHLQPYTHARGHDEGSASRQAPQTSHGEAAVVEAVLRRGEMLLFLYTTKHAATPNLTEELERCLLYAVYGPAGKRDTINFWASHPSLFEEPAQKGGAEGSWRGRKSRRRR